MMIPLSRVMSQRVLLHSRVSTSPVVLAGVLTTIMVVFGVLNDWMWSISGWNRSSSASLY